MVNAALPGDDLTPAQDVSQRRLCVCEPVGLHFLYVFVYHTHLAQGFEIAFLPSSPLRACPCINYPEHKPQLSSGSEMFSPFMYL